VLSCAMTLNLPPPLAAMVAAHNAHDSAAFTECFSEDAVVRDEGQMYFGKPAVQTWFEDVSRKYSPIFQVTSVSVIDGEPVLTGSVSGEFPGSPIELRYYTGLEDGKIVALKIAP
jgi:hypothetical protein